MGENRSKAKPREPGNYQKSSADGFRTAVLKYYGEHGRDLPWRDTCDPYRIFVSEMMLQQTQVERVLQKYAPFISALPDFKALSEAPLGKILSLWGLGYNRRCIAMKKSASIILERWGGEIDRTVEELVDLPGIGRATASAILCFAFNRPTVFLETNIRNVYIHFFFGKREGEKVETGVSDREILPLVELTLDRKNPRQWYYALMDYGAMLKKECPGLNARSIHYTKQAPFEGSNRQVRGMILRALARHGALPIDVLLDLAGIEAGRLSAVLSGLEKEGFITRSSNTCTLSRG